MIKVQNNTATRDPLPSFLVGLSAQTLRDLAWTDPQLGVQDCAWLPEVDQSPALGPDQTHDGTEVLTVDAQLQVVLVVRGVRDLTPEEIHQRWLADNPVPASISWRQGQHVLIDLGVRQQVRDMIAAIEDPVAREKAEVEFGSPTYERASPFLCSMWEALGRTPQQLDDAFRAASLT